MKIYSLKYQLLLLVLLFTSVASFAQNTGRLSGVLTDLEGKPIEEVVVSIDNRSQIAVTDSKGKFSFQLEKNRNYTLSFQSLNITPFQRTILFKNDSLLSFTTKRKVVSLSEVTVEAESDPFGVRKLRPTEGGGLYEGKKTEVINIEKLVGNKAANNPRQAFSKVPGLNIWESDNAGLQLDIGGRGLSPKRTTNFNTRQNGYDISADALGYPESYYTPPLQAVKQIEIVRGAGALQYGTQFGGLVNFKMKKGNREKSFNFESENSYGSYQFINSFNSFHGQTKKLNYYSYVQYKQGDGWRKNSQFEQYGAFAGLQYDVSKKLKIGFEYTYMYYLSQQPGGLVDEVFEEDPSSSNRSRNWFKVNWNLLALSLEYQLSENTTVYNRTFGLIASRTSLGLLETPDLEDPLSNRDLIEGNFKNIGNETRVVINYKGFGEDLKNTLLIGTRLYRGFTNFGQQFGTDGSGSYFTRVDTAFLDRRKSDFDFPNFNAAIFVEKILRFSPSFSLIPGLRYEHINTKSDGFFTNTQRTNSFGDFEETITNETSEKNRNILLYGLGMSKKLKFKYELYANATANYRAINFTDVQIQTNTQLVDPNIQDESGYSFDLGIRRMSFSPFFVEVNLFYILYDNRIGEVIDDGLRVRTNIGSARIYGVELYGELNVLKLLKKESKHTISIFVNGSANKGVYTEINNRALVGVRSGNQLEDLPDYNIKTGISYGYKKFKTALQATFVGNQFSDAANTEVAFVGVFGPIPAYSVLDLSANYEISKTVSVAGSINNLLNNSYFTRRATAYPGPGIIPAAVRIGTITLKIRL
mgnify:CR=1 FL=1|tara:strand:+ start:84550 stop:86985 length:2436 start_codon:yes stop_codon:yes gene_type:complete